MNKWTTEYLYADFKSVAEYTPEYATAFFEKYADYFKTVNTLKDSTDLNLYMELTWQHLHLLYVKKRYAETFTTAATYLKIIDDEIHRLNGGSAQNDWYDGILLLKGMSAYRLGALKVATPIFKRLTQREGKNENVKTWYRYSIYQHYRRVSRASTIVCAILFLTVFFFDKQIASYLLKMTMLGFAIVGLVATICFDLYIKRALKKSPLEKVA